MQGVRYVNDVTESGPSRRTLPMGGGLPTSPGRFAGRTEGTLRFDRLLGSGGIGEVYEATELATGARVAVKTLLPAFRDVAEAVGRIEREAKAGGLLDHPNIVDVTAFGLLSDGTPYLVMELVRGIDLGSLLDQGPIEPRRALAIAHQTLDGLGHAHALGVMHRDLKPENLMITTDAGGERVKILDLGLAKLMGLAEAVLGSEKLTATGAIFGTPAYMAPEQALGRPATPATDLYTVGVILFEMLMGKQPFVGIDAQATMRLHVSAPIPALSTTAPWYSVELASLVERALQKEPAARFATAMEMRTAIAVAERARQSSSS